MIREEIAGAVDSHVHVIDPSRFPPPEGPGHKPESGDEASAGALDEILARHGVAHAVVVQLSGYGTDNTCILDAVAVSQGRWRAVVAIDAGIAEPALDALVAAGAVGVRFNVANLGPGAMAGAGRLLAMLAERRLVAQVQCPAALLPDIAPVLEAGRATLLFDHLGFPDVAAGIDEPGFRRLLAFGRSGAFVKLSGGFRLSRRPFPHDDLDPFVERIREAFAPERRVWGSDFPFVKVHRRPSYAQTLDLLGRWLPDENERRAALHSNPRRLFGFPP